MRRVAQGIGLAVLLTGCADRTLVVESDTSWAGSVDKVGQVSGQGGTRIELEPSAGHQCWDLHKTTSAGTLRAYVRDKSNFTGTDTEGDMTTTAPDGHATGCVG